MPLSDHEQQLLDQLEKQLRSEDPRFARNISETQAAVSGPGFSAKRFVVGILVALLGLAATIFAISMVNQAVAWIALGVVGFGSWSQACTGRSAPRPSGQCVEGRHRRPGPEVELQGNLGRLHEPDRRPVGEAPARRMISHFVVSDALADD